MLLDVRRTKLSQGSWIYNHK